MELRSISMLLPAWRKTKGLQSALQVDCSPAVRMEQEKAKTPGKLTPAQIQEAAENAVVRLEGDVSNDLHVLGQHTLQFGKYAHKSFVWVLSNDPWYCTSLVAGWNVQRRKRGLISSKAFNIWRLRKYMSMFPEGRALMTSENIVEPLAVPRWKRVFEYRMKAAEGSDSTSTARSPGVSAVKGRGGMGSLVTSAQGTHGGRQKTMPVSRGGHTSSSKFRTTDSSTSPEPTHAMQTRARTSSPSASANGMSTQASRSPASTDDATNIFGRMSSVSVRLGVLKTGAAPTSSVVMNTPAASATAVSTHVVNVCATKASMSAVTDAMNTPGTMSPASTYAGNVCPEEAPVPISTRVINSGATELYVSARVMDTHATKTLACTQAMDVSATESPSSALDRCGGTDSLVPTWIAVSSAPSQGRTRCAAESLGPFDPVNKRETESLESMDVTNVYETQSFDFTDAMNACETESFDHACAVKKWESEWESLESTDASNIHKTESFDFTNVMKVCKTELFDQARAVNTRETESLDSTDAMNTSATKSLMPADTICISTAESRVSASTNAMYTSATGSPVSTSTQAMNTCTAESGVLASTDAIPCAKESPAFSDIWKTAASVSPTATNPRNRWVGETLEATQVVDRRAAELSVSSCTLDMSSCTRTTAADVTDKEPTCTSKPEQADSGHEDIVGDFIEEDFPLPSGWRRNLPEQDHRWVSDALFKWSHDGRPLLDKKRLDRIWFYPPTPDLCLCKSPKSELYFAHRLCLWLPKTVWKYSFRCPQETCKGRELISAGLCSRVRKVLDVDSQYYLASERLKCPACKGKLVSWSGPLLRQMDAVHRSQFPAVLTPHLACDVKVVKLMRHRSPGTSPAQLLRCLEEQHTERYLSQASSYLQNFSTFCKTARFSAVIASCPTVPPPMDVLPPCHRLQAVYLRDVCERLEDNQAAATSVFGSVLALDSSKKVTLKLQGTCTSAWSTNIGTEYGQVLTSVLTSQEGKGLSNMLLGLQLRYSKTGIAPPQLLYVDRDCCDGQMRSMLHPYWSRTAIRLDVGRYMRRIAAAVTTEAHPLYHKFMSQLSRAVLVWDKEDLDKLFRAKRAELRREGFLRLSDGDVLRRIGCEDLARHCRRTTRGVEDTRRLIQNLLETYSSEQGKDWLGVPLLNKERTWQVWQEQERHLACIQDPPTMDLYTQTGTATKGGVCLPVYRCARGMMSLERFHLYMKGFVPGDCGSDVHYQACWAEGVARWNQERGFACVEEARPGHPRVHSAQQLHNLNRLSTEVLGMNLLTEFGSRPAYTGEKLGLEYLLCQNGDTLMGRVDQAFCEDVDMGPTAEMNGGGVPDEGGVEKSREEEEMDHTIFPLSEEDFPQHTLMEEIQLSTENDRSGKDQFVCADCSSGKGEDTESFEDMKPDLARSTTSDLAPLLPLPAPSITLEENIGASWSAKKALVAPVQRNTPKTFQTSAPTTSPSVLDAEQPQLSGNVAGDPFSEHPLNRKRKLDESMDSNKSKVQHDNVKMTEDEKAKKLFRQSSLQNRLKRNKTLVSAAIASRKIRLERENVQLEKEKVQLERDRLQLEAEKLQLEKRLQLEAEKLQIENRLQIESEKLQLEKLRMEVKQLQVQLEGKCV